MVTILDLKKDVFIAYIAFFSPRFRIIIYLLQKIKIPILDSKKVIILLEYLDYTYVFLENFTIKFLKYIGINNNYINLINNK